MTPGDSAITRRRALLSCTLSALVALLVAVPAQAGTYRSTGAISIPDVGNASPFPSTLVVEGQGGLITDVDVTLFGVDHTEPKDLDILVRSPSGQQVALLSDACDTNDVADATWRFDQDAGATFPMAAPCPGGTYRPINYGDRDGWPEGVPGTVLDDLDGRNANGTWRLYVLDDSSGDSGQIELGWQLDITTGPSEMLIPGSGTIGLGSPYPITRTVAGVGGIVTDVNVLVDGFTHNNPDDVDLFLEGPQGQRAWLLSDGCGNDDLTDHDFLFDDEASVRLTTNSAGECAAPHVRTVNYDGGLGAGDDAFPAPASPPAANATALSAFDLTEPDGAWNLYAVDDQDGNSGFLVGPFELQIATRPPSAVAFAPTAIAGSEGGVARVRLARTGPGPYGRGTVELFTTAGTALPGRDFSPIATTVVFDPGQAERLVDVPLTKDTQREAAETFTVGVRNADVDAAIVGPTAATVTIAADPVVPFTARNSLSAPTSRRCRRRGERLRFRPREPAAVQFSRLEAFVNGRRVRDRAGALADDAFSLRVRGRRMRVRIRVTATDGRQVSVRRTYRRCGRARRSAG